MPTFSASDGLTLNYTRWDGDGNHRPVVLQHGIVADTNANWMGPGVVDALRAAGLTVLSLDARGHGRSATPHDPAAYGWAAMVQDIRTLLDVTGLDDVALVGYSMGGILALDATAADDRIKRLAIGGIGSGVVDVGGIDHRAFGPDRERAFQGLLTAFETGDPAGLPATSAPFRMLADLLQADRLALAAVVKGAADGDPPHLDLTAIKVPTLVLAGEDDPLATEPERLAAAIPGAELRVVPGDHLGAVLHPDFSAALVEFLTAG